MHLRLCEGLKDGCTNKVAAKKTALEPCQGVLLGKHCSWPDTVFNKCALCSSRMIAPHFTRNVHLDRFWHLCSCLTAVTLLRLILPEEWT